MRNWHHKALAALILCGVSGTALAMESFYIEEMVVTAQKREQSVQDVPISISAFDTQFLDDAGVDDALELQFFVPGLTVFNNQSVAQTSFSIRGVGTAGNSVSLESSVGIYVDGVYRSRQSSGINDFLDVERVEVLRGPQGTIFGKNTASGAIQILTVAPQMDELGGFIEGQAGNEAYRNLNGAINLPILEGKIAARISGQWIERDGLVDNRATGNEINDRDRYALRGQLLFDFTDSLSLRIIGDYSEIDEQCCSAANVFDGPGDTNALFAAAGGIPGLGVDPALGASYRFPVEALGGDVVLANDFDDDDVAMDIDPSAKIEESGFSAELTWDIGEITLTSLTAYRYYEATGFVDADFTSLDTLSQSSSITEQDTWTQELRINGLIGDRISYVAGAYYFDQDLDDETALRVGADGNTLLTGGATLAQLDAAGAFDPPFPAGAICAGLVDPGLVPLCPLPAFPAGEGSDNISEQDQESWAVFAQADIDVTEKLIATLGVRYTDEEKTMNVIFTETIPTPAFAAFTPLSPLVPDVNDLKFDEDEWTGTAKLSYFFNDAFMSYISYGRGFKSGGTNIDRIDPATGAPLLFDPELSDSYEIGMKADFFENRLRLNASAYYTEFDDFQANTFVGTGFVLQNAGEITTQGFEAELFALPFDWLSIQSGVAYVDAEYDTFEAGACIRTPLTSSPDAGEPNFPTTCDNSGNVVPGTPEWTWYGSANGSYTLRDGSFIYGQLDINWNDDIEAGNDNDQLKVQDSFTLVNARIGYRFGNERYDLALWGKNIFDEDYHGGAFNSVIREGSLSAYHTEPRTWGATLRATF